MFPHPLWLGGVPGGGYSLEYSECVLQLYLSVSPVGNVSSPFMVKWGPCWWWNIQSDDRKKQYFCTRNASK